MNTINQLSLLVTLCYLLFLTSCESDEPGSSPVFLDNNELIITDIYGIPSNITFNKIKAEIQGYDWQIVEVIEADYIAGKAILSLPTTFPDDKLMKATRENRSDYSGFWHAHTDNANAKVAGLSDIVAYINDERVGTLLFTDWTGSGSRELKTNIYYHYANDSYYLIDPKSDTNKSYTFRASFIKGWNAHAELLPLNSQIGITKTLCTAPVPADRKYIWHFQPLSY